MAAWTHACFIRLQLSSWLMDAEFRVESSLDSTSISHLDSCDLMEQACYHAAMAENRPVPAVPPPGRYKGVVPLDSLSHALHEMATHTVTNATNQYGEPSVDCTVITLRLGTKNCMRLNVAPETVVTARTFDLAPRYARW